MITFGHSGGLGDIVYSLKTVRKICEMKNDQATIYVKRYNHYNNTVDNYDAIKYLLLSQPYIKNVEPYPGHYPVCVWDNDVKLDYDLDKFRNSLNLFLFHLIQNSLASQGLEYTLDWNTPWLYPANSVVASNFIIINKTERYKGNGDSNWPKIINQYDCIKFFIGLEREYELFDKQYKMSEVIYKKTEDLYEAYNYISSSEAVICNQSVCLTIAQGLGKKYHLDIAPNHNKTVRLFTSNENIL